jgi:hypothetical protein
MQLDGKFAQCPAAVEYPVHVVVYLVVIYYTVDNLFLTTPVVQG